MDAGGVIAIFFFLPLPLYALSPLTTWVDWKILAGLLLGVSIIAYFTCRADKRRAEAGDWRISELTLHMFELLGGWPGSFLAQRMFRHKISKTSYQVEFWLIVLFHQLLAFDSLSGRRLSKAVFRLFNH